MASRAAVAMVTVGAVTAMSDKTAGDGDAGSVGTLTLVGLALLGLCACVVWGLICMMAPCTKACAKFLLRMIAPDWYDDRFGNGDRAALGLKRKVL